MRVKEEADDYRYFREPDLVDLVPDQAWQDRVRDALKRCPPSGAPFSRNDSRSGARIARRPRSGDRPRSRSVRHRGSRRRRSADLALARAANEIASDLEHVENLSIESYVATLNMEQSGALSATQAKTVLGRYSRTGRAGVDRPEQGIRATRLGCVGESWPS